MSNLRGRRTSSSNKLLGEGSVCSVLLRKLHPQDVVSHAFSNHITTDRLSDLVAVKQGQGCRAGGGVTKVAVFFSTPSIPDVEVWAAIGFTKVLTSCDPSKVFAPATTSTTAASAALPGTAGVDREGLHLTNDLDEDIARVRELGLTVDDDREPAEENVPSVRNNFEMDPTTSLYVGQKWRWDGHCQRALATSTKQAPTFHGGWQPTDDDLFKGFTKLLPMDWFENVLVPGTSKNLVDAGETETNLGEMLCWLGLKGLMASHVGFSQRDFFNGMEFNKRHNPCPYKLNMYISMCRMERLDQHICFTDHLPPAFIDKFWEVRQMIWCMAAEHEGIVQSSLGCMS